ncbi:hypothetical protein J2Y55_001120 [Bosea sp. BE125]|uniref:hypothetical protein n=1 Tax=Bosea sp. BE125 TaxID=2817909 RepID=UPI002862026C|nr:hypothetical protein [Bosea sp. BE125]MDR6870120.1 hypothetical protein [Bosea sp. BE125]
MLNIETSIGETELRNFWTVARELAEAKRRRRFGAIRNAIDEIEAIAMHTKRPALRTAAQRLLAS